MLIAKRKTTATPSSGTFTVVIPHSVDAILRRIYISPATQTTTYDFTVTDADGAVFPEVVDQTGRFNDNNVNLPTDAPLTLVVDNASVNELFSIIFVFET